MSIALNSSAFRENMPLLMTINRNYVKYILTFLYTIKSSRDVLPLLMIQKYRINVIISAQFHYIQFICLKQLSAVIIAKMME